MCEILNIRTHVKCVWCACRYGCFLFAIVCKNVCNSADVQNFARPLKCQICVMCMQVLQLEFVCKKLWKCVQKWEYASAHMHNVCDMRAGFATGVFFAIMCAKVKFHTCAKCVRCTCRFRNWSLFAIMCAKFCTFTHVRNACLFITALLPTAKIQESQFAYLPTD